MALTRIKVLCVGCVVLDRIFLVRELPSGPSKIVAQDFLERGGGMAATAAACIAALGGEVALVARVGDDTAGSALIAELKRVGVDVKYLRRLKGAITATSAVHVDASGERMLTNFRGSFPEDMKWLPLDETEHHSAVLADIRWPAGARAAFAEARREGVPSILDADAGDPIALADLLPETDHIIFSDQGLRELSGSSNIERNLRAVRSHERQVVGVTLGRRGSIWLHANRIWGVPAAEVEAVNSNGVGDVFHGAYALAIAQGRSVPEAACFATAAAGAKCRDIRGWDGMPSRSQVEALLHNLPPQGTASANRGRVSAWQSSSTP